MQPTHTGSAKVGFIFFVLSFCGCLTLHAKSSAPEWLTAITAKPASFDYGKAKAVVLDDEEWIALKDDGRRTTRTRWVVRLLTPDGKDQTHAYLSYNTEKHRIKSFQTWLIKANGDVVTYGKKETLDTLVNSTGRDLYSGARQMHISASDIAEAGAVFAYETVVDEKSDDAQYYWRFQNALPVEYSGIVLSLPQGWKATGHTFNHEPITPHVEGSSFTWALRCIPACERESFGPPSDATQAWLGVDIVPPEGVNTTLVRSSNWAELSAFLSRKYDAASTPDVTIKAKADALASGSANSWECIRRLCLHAQQVSYVEIFMNSAASGGVIPRDAAIVFKKNYGDCKDKAALLCSLLKTQGIESFPLVVYSGDARHVRPDWPSLCQFNHCILAIKVDDSVNVPALIVHPTFGRLVIFDPTNTNTPPGWLPEEVHGGCGLILAGAAGELITLPRMTGDNNRTERKVEARLLADGSVTGSLQETSHGITASDERDLLLGQSATGYRKTIEKWIARGLPTARVDQVEPADQFDQASFTLKTSFTARAHGKFMRDTMLIFKPVLVARRNGTFLLKEKRTQPVVIEAKAFSEHSRIELPDGFQIEELPAAVELKTAFGTYSIRQHIESQKYLIVERTLTVSDAVIPAADYETVRTFYEKIIKAEQSPVVLKLQPAL